ncbi:S-layer homology domain-containing protein, partial [Bacillus pseudomycoides]|uniref:S-layer homology domain-containing protein n=1 Tax=Bacillus pseudomycoides TaxID=64104 RepID=UPI00211D90F9
NSNQNIKAASAQTSSFIDVSQSHWAYKEIQYMAEHNIMREYGNGYFGAKDKVTREQLAAFLYRSIPVSSRPLQVN